MCSLVSTWIRPIHIIFSKKLTLNTSFHVISALMDLMPFVESFVVETFQEDFNTKINLLMFVDPHIDFAMFFYYYA